MDLLFEFVNIDDNKKKKLTENKPLSAFFDRVTSREAVLSQRTEDGESTMSGLTESYRLRGMWTIGIAGKGNIDEALECISGQAAITIEPIASGMYIRIDGGNASSSALINAVGRIVQILSVQSSAMSELDANSGVPVEIYYRPPISNDELLHGIKHSKEHFDQTLSDITEYDSYCAKHPDFKNQITIHATKNILQTYDKCTAEASFL